jgi:sec-independent protein translocase protein TatB
MFDLSWSHIAILVVVALLVLGPKELPNAIRTGAQLLRTGRKLAGEFRSGFDELIREAELEDTRRTIREAMEGGLEKTLAEHVDPTGEIKGAISSNPLTEAEAEEHAAGSVEPKAEVASLEPPAEAGTTEPAAIRSTLREPVPGEASQVEASAAEPGAVPPGEIQPAPTSGTDSDVDAELKKKTA